MAEPEWMARLGALADDLWQRGDKTTSSALHDVRRLVQDEIRQARATADLASRLNEVELWIDRVSYIKGAESMYAPLRQRRDFLRGQLDRLRTPPAP